MLDDSNLTYKDLSQNALTVTHQNNLVNEKSRVGKEKEGEGMLYRSRVRHK